MKVNPATTLVGLLTIRARMKRKWNRRQLAKAASTSIRNVTRLEHGDAVSVAVLLRVADALRIAPSSLIPTKSVNKRLLKVAKES